VADAAQLRRLFFPEVHDCICRRRLARIAEQAEEINRTMAPWSRWYVYYAGKVRQLEHKRLVTEFYCRLHEGGGEVLEFIPEYSVGGLRADAYAEYAVGDRVYHFALEVQISSAFFDAQKYLDLYHAPSWPWPTFPRVLVVSDRKQRFPEGPRFFQVGTDYEGWEMAME
jgi:hypothetical protein